MPWPMPPDPAETPIPPWDFKEGVADSEPHPRIMAARQILAHAWTAWWGEVMVITATDGMRPDGTREPHRPDSKHFARPLHEAEDYRLPGPLRGFLEEVRTRLGPGYQLLLEKDHIHIELA